MSQLSTKDMRTWNITFHCISFYKVLSAINTIGILDPKVYNYTNLMKILAKPFNPSVNLLK